MLEKIVSSGAYSERSVHFFAHTLKTPFREFAARLCAKVTVLGLTGSRSAPLKKEMITMDWKALKQALQGGGGYDLAISGPIGQSKTITLTMFAGPSGVTRTFSTLGSGSMKRVVLDSEREWVLALAGDSPAARDDMTDEVRTLLDIAREGVRVPEPFNSGALGEILFDLTIYNEDLGDSKVYPVFLQQYLPFIEMDKLKERRDFAKDFIVSGPLLPTNIETTVSDLEAILLALKKREWGDFQVIYDPVSGKVFVFDPLPENNSGVSSIPIVEKWLVDIAAARRSHVRPIKPAKTLQGSWEV